MCFSPAIQEPALLPYSRTSIFIMLEIPKVPSTLFPTQKGYEKVIFSVTKFNKRMFKASKEGSSRALSFELCSNQSRMIKWEDA